MSMRIVLGFTLTCALVVSAGCDRDPEPAGVSGTAASGAGGGAAGYTIAMIPKGTQHVFWSSVEAGAREAEKETGAKVIWKGPLKEDDRAEQINLMQQFISQGVDGIALAPLDSRALASAVRSAGDREVPVVIFDSALDGEAGKDFISLVATDNRQGGRLAGQEMVRLLNGKGKVVLLRYAVGSASTDEREAGFLEVVRAAPGIQIISDNRYAGATASEAQTQAMNMLDTLRQADGLFTPNESSTYGTLLALRQSNLAGKLKFVGFDASPPLIDALRKGEVNALVVQNPRKMGYETVKAMVAHLKGEQVPQSIDTGAALVTPQNVSDPSIQQIIQ